MHRTLVYSFLALELCATAPAVAREHTSNAEPLPGAACVYPSTVTSPFVDDDGKVVFRGNPDPRKSYAVTFDGRCAGLNRFAAISYERIGPRYCKGDRVRVFSLPITIPGGVCTVARLTPISLK